MWAATTFPASRFETHRRASAAMLLSVRPEGEPDEVIE
jgi:hypothetical protein